VTATGQISDATCQACATHTTSPKGSSVDTQCICKKGYTGADGGPCSSCDAGYYKSVTGSSSCIQCPAGKYSDAASSRCNRCPANSYSTVPAAGLTACKCNAGYTGPDGGTCTICPAGTYKSTTGDCLSHPRKSVVVVSLIFKYPLQALLSAHLALPTRGHFRAAPAPRIHQCATHAPSLRAPIPGALGSPRVSATWVTLAQTAHRALRVLLEATRTQWALQLALAAKRGLGQTLLPLPLTRHA